MSATAEDLRNTEARLRLVRMSGRSAHEIAAEIRLRLPGVPVENVHALLYYAQGHHLATTGRPLFDEAITAGERGPVVVRLLAAEALGQAQLPIALPLDRFEVNATAYVIGRYGQLSTTDLGHLTRSGSPWRDAARSTDRRITHESLAAHFRATGVTPDDDRAQPASDGPGSPERPSWAT